MPKYVTVSINLSMQDDEPRYVDHYALVDDSQVSALLNVLNDAANAAVRQLPTGTALVFETNWSGIKWAIDRPSDHTVEDETTEEEDVA